MTASAAVRCSLSAAEFTDRESIVLVTYGHIKDTERDVFVRYRYIYNLFPVHCESVVFLTLCRHHSS